MENSDLYAFLERNGTVFNFPLSNEEIYVKNEAIYVKNKGWIHYSNLSVGDITQYGTIVHIGTKTKIFKPNLLTLWDCIKNEELFYFLP